MMNRIHQTIADELAVKLHQVRAAAELLAEGATVPFIARYRKEATGGLDDSQLRLLEERLHYLQELEARRTTIVEAIKGQGKLSPELEKAIGQAVTKTQLEDLYLPYKKKRHTKAQLARAAGLEPLAQALLRDPQLEPTTQARHFVGTDKGVTDVNAALEGARQILMEIMAEEASLIGGLRDYLWAQGVLNSKMNKGKATSNSKFSDYFDYREPIVKIPSHRALALFRGRNEGVLMLKLDVDIDAQPRHPCEARIAGYFGIRDMGKPADAWLLETVRWAWKIKIQPHLELDLMARLRASAETEAIKVFSTNLHDLLLAAPAGPRVIMGLDPGLRTGVKVAVVNGTGKVLATATVYPHVPQNRWDEAIEILAALARDHQVGLISLGNGTASRETDRLLVELIHRYPQLKLLKTIVSEAGASVYSASELASKEFPDLDVSLRGAASIARRLQDPLAELVKIEPKSIGVGQYQHDVNQTQLARSLDGVVEDCVNAVGVDLNTASAALMSRVSGLNQGLASNIVEFRDANGVFASRKQLLKVPRLGAKAFEQAAGFLRIRNGENPLDASAVHPEAYPVVESIVRKTGRNVQSLLGDHAFLRSLRPQDYTCEHFGIPTVSDILSELDKPGRDPRPEFKAAVFREGVDSVQALRTDMILEGVITNVTKFGAFVDIGVHQDGLVHISAMSTQYVKDPRDVVRTGDFVKVRVLDIDLERNRISLSLRLTDDSRERVQPLSKEGVKSNKKPDNHTTSPANNAMADALHRVLRR